MRLPTVFSVFALSVIALFVGAPILASVQEGVSRDGAEQQGPPVAPKSSLIDLPIVRITVEGENRYTERQLISALGQSVGKPVDPVALQRGIKVLWKAFHVLASEYLREAEGGIELLLRVRELPVDLEPRFVGNQKISIDTLREWTLLEEQSELFLHQAPRIQQRLLERYHAEGFVFAEVRQVVHGVDDDGDDPPDVIFEIKEGPKVRVRKVLVNGNESFPDQGFGFWKGGLQKLARTKLSSKPVKRWWFPFDWLNPFNWSRGDVFVRDVLDGDLLSMRTVYRDRGWLDAVVELDRVEYSDDRSMVDLHIIIDEGEPYVVDALEIEVVKFVREPATGRFVEEPAEFLFPREELLELFELQPGVRYGQNELNRDRRAVSDFYGSRGYISHPSLARDASWEWLAPKVAFDPDSRTLGLTYRIVQGRQQFIREVLFNGSTKTRDRVIRREVRATPGERADLEKIQRSLSNLRRTGYFSHPVDPDHREPTFRFLPTDDPDEVDLEFVLEEGRGADFNIGGSVGTDGGLAGFVTFRVPNFDLFDPPSSLWSTFSEVYSGDAFRGGGQQLDLSLSPGSLIDFWLLHFYEPDIFMRHYDPISFDLRLQARDRIFTSHDEHREDYTPTLGRRITDDLRINLGVTLQEIELDDLEDDEPIPSTLENSEGTIDLLGGTFSLVYRTVDNRRAPRKGMDFVFKNSFFGGSEEFYKTDIRFEFYEPIGNPLDDVRPGWHLGLWGGVSDTFGNTDEVPYSERYFLGGSRVLRGFEFRGVGPNEGTDFPLGGETYLRGSAEFRIPLQTVVQPGSYKEQEAFHVLLFADWGILDPDPYSLNLNELRASVGFGFGLMTPIAPLRFDFGFPVEKGSGDDTRVFSFFFGL